ncbi:hypothetical protein ABEB36_012017 [Hypothenemus hampei]|uniref:Dual specificity protein phosphatase 19 n=1 Tax=Hypothenemus hampei TaxID=57062 RepID=A0ABD1EAL1_HYPHA
MSFLTKLQENKSKLKPTKTIITQQDGQKFLETNQQLVKLQETSTGYVVDTKPDNVPAKIIEHLYLGSQDCCEIEVLDKFDIKFVLSLGVDAYIKIPNVNYKFVNMLDLDVTDLTNYLPECFEFINNALTCMSNILVHCNAGVSRSASIVISYLILCNKMSFTEAYERVKVARPCIRPNDGFMDRLRNL